MKFNYWIWYYLKFVKMNYLVDLFTISSYLCIYHIFFWATVKFYLSSPTIFRAATLAMKETKSDSRDRDTCKEDVFFTCSVLYCSFSLLLFVSIIVITKLFIFFYLPPQTSSSTNISHVWTQMRQIIYHSFFIYDHV